MSQTAPTQAPARAWGPNWVGSPSQVAFAEFALYSQPWLGAALSHRELSEWLVPLPWLFSLCCFLLHVSLLISPYFLFSFLTSFLFFKYVLLCLAFSLYFELLPLLPFNPFTIYIEFCNVTQKT